MQNCVASNLWRLVYTFGLQGSLKAGPSSHAWSWAHVLVGPLLGVTVELDSTVKLEWDLFLGTLGLGLRGHSSMGLGVHSGHTTPVHVCA